LKYQANPEKTAINSAGGGEAGVTSLPHSVDDANITVYRHRPIFNIQVRHNMQIL